MNFIARDVILQAIEAAAPVLARLKKRDRELESQLRRALNSAGLNLEEGNAYRDGNRRKHFAIAAGSAKEARMALRMAMALRYVAVGDVERADALLDRFGGLLWGLRHGR